MNRDCGSRDLEKRCEQGNDGIIDVITKGMKRYQDRLQGCRPALIEDYFHGKIGFHAHFLARVDGMGSPSHPYCVLFKREPSQGLGVLERFFPVRESVSVNTETSPGTPQRLGPAQSKCAVLVDNVQPVNFPEGILGEIIPSVVRLKLLDDRTGAGCHTPNLFGPILRVGFTSKNWKSRADNLVVAHRSGVLLGECEGQMIERGSQVEKAVSNDDAQFQGDVGHSVDAIAASLGINSQRLKWGIWISLIDDSVGFGCDPSSGILLEAVDVFACSLELEKPTIRNSHCANL